MILEIVGTLLLTWLGFKTLQLATCAVGSLARGVYRLLSGRRRAGEIRVAPPAGGRRASRLAPVSCR